MTDTVKHLTQQANKRTATEKKMQQSFDEKLHQSSNKQKGNVRMIDYHSIYI